MRAALQKTQAKLLRSSAVARKSGGGPASAGDQDQNPPYPHMVGLETRGFAPTRFDLAAPSSVLCQLSSVTPDLFFLQIRWGLEHDNLVQWGFAPTRFRELGWASPRPASFSLFCLLYRLGSVSVLCQLQRACWPSNEFGRASPRLGLVNFAGLRPDLVS